MGKAWRKEPSSRLLILSIQGVIICSALMLFFIFAYTVFDILNIGNPSVVTQNKSIEDIVATFGNERSDAFTRNLSRALPMATSIVGQIDDLRRGPDGRIYMRGWTLDRNDISQPLLVFLVIPKKAVLMTSTGKTRDDVPKALNLPQEASASGFDDTFSYQFNCKDNENNYYIVAVNQKRQFSLIRSRIRIDGC